VPFFTYFFKFSFIFVVLPLFRCFLNKKAVTKDTLNSFFRIAESDPTGKRFSSAT
jgi:hypothetical protein